MLDLAEIGKAFFPDACYIFSHPFLNEVGRKECLDMGKRFTFKSFRSGNTVNGENLK